MVGPRYVLGGNGGVCACSRVGVHRWAVFAFTVCVKFSFREWGPCGTLPGLPAQLSGQARLQHHGQHPAAVPSPPELLTRRFSTSPALSPLDNWGSPGAHKSGTRLGESLGFRLLSPQTFLVK